MSEEMERFEVAVNTDRLRDRILGESCESCMQREFEYVCVWGTFVCRGCLLEGV